jgi:small subunit ribosomal protein S13
MAIRIVGVDLPQNKRGEIALTYIFGIGRSSSAKILEKAGVDTVKELAHRVPANLAAKCNEVNAAHKIVGRVPVEKEIAKMVEEAKTLPPMMEY